MFVLYKISIKYLKFFKVKDSEMHIDQYRCKKEGNTQYVFSPLQSKCVLPDSAFPANSYPTADFPVKTCLFSQNLTSYIINLKIIIVYFKIYISNIKHREEMFAKVNLFSITLIKQ